MLGSTTTIIDLKDLERGLPESVTIVKLMAICNDFQLANEAMARWLDRESRRDSHRRSGALQYFMRLQVSHVFEALSVLKKVESSRGLMNEIARLSTVGQEAFRRVTEPTARERFRGIAVRIRNNLTFHYEKSGRSFEKAIRDRASRPEGRYSSITSGTSLTGWRFRVADDLIDSITARQIFGISPEEDLRAASDEVATALFEYVRDFVNFSAELIVRLYRRT